MTHLHQENKTIHHLPSQPIHGLICSSCASSIVPTSVFGFCSNCGSILCETCAQRTKSVIESDTSKLPMVIVTHRKTVTVHAKVPVCRKCLEFDAQLEANPESLSSIDWIYLIAGIFFLILFPVLWYLGYTTVCVILFTLIIGIGGVYLTLSIILNKSKRTRIVYRPRCPACGFDLMPRYLKIAMGTLECNENYWNFAWCNHCGYEGLRFPYDGLWRYIDLYGISPLIGTRVEPLARFSYHFKQRSVPRK